MGTYATIALVFSLLFYMGMRRNMQQYTQKGGFFLVPTPTNFHQEASVARPNHGIYTQPVFENVYQN